MSRPVYSTEHGRLCPDCGHPKAGCICAQRSTVARGDGIVRVSRETKGRKGKGVTLVTGVPLSGEELKNLGKDLRQKLGTGGSLKDGVLEFQGDHRQALKPLLEARGFTVKLAGG